MKFYEALPHIEDYCIARRYGWNGKGMFVVKQVISTIIPDIIPTMTSLPIQAKQVLIPRNEPLHYQNQMIIVNSDNVINSWIPSSADLFANDWEIFHDGKWKKEKDLTV